MRQKQLKMMYPGLKKTKNIKNEAEMIEHDVSRA